MRHEELDILYKELDFRSGDLHPVADNPSGCQNSIDWLEKGEWLAAAKRAGAEALFFVANNPVAVFAQCGAGLEEKIKAFNRVWCLARPRLFFLASPGEITVYDLAQKPIDEKKHREWKKLKSLATLKEIGKTAEKLQKFHRDNVESGRLFADKRFGDLKNRADESLIRNLKTVRRELIHAGLSRDKIRFAHALIGRSIFIRYLEDRGILTEEYFYRIARKKAGRTGLLKNPINRRGIDFSHHTTFYPRILEDKDFTYDLFRSLARDFNGDMFPGVDEEEKAVNKDHLKLIQDLLYGDVGIQKKLFFFSYRFDIVPLDLISSIYEEFYHLSPDDSESKNKRRQGGAYYTPPVLVEFILSRVLSPDVLEKTPRVMDPACGSGIFLVEAFRRIVRYEWHKNKQPLQFDILKRILKDQIAGIEVNEEAARIAAFSLYLAMLHYLSPPAIDKQLKMGRRLPNLLAAPNLSSNNFQCILAANAFDTGRIDAVVHWKKRFGKDCADVVIGNPPWGAPGTRAAREIKNRHKIVVDWCLENNKAIGDKEHSQAFLWRSLDLLKENGIGGMLVSAGVLLKHHKSSRAFRREWLNCVKLGEVFNFSHVRTVFFNGAISPFTAILFRKGKQGDDPVYYWSAKQSRAIKKVQNIILSKNDLKIIRSPNLADHRIWKLFFWGSHKDYQFLRNLDNLPHTVTLADESLFSCVGFKEGNQSKNAGWLSSFKKVKVNAFSRYEKLGDKAFEEIPEKVECHGGDIGTYEGRRLIVKEAPRQAHGTNGRIIARFETDSYANNHSLHVLKLSEDVDWKYQVLIGILWSSFARYYLFLTTYFWGLWRDKVLVSERLRLPVVFDRSNPVTEEIITIVENLRNYHPEKKDGLHPNGVSENEIKAQRRQWESQLDEKVFQLYGLSGEEIDLINDLCEITLPFYYKPFDSTGAMPALEKNDYWWIKKYVTTFCKSWNPYLDEGQEMRAEIHTGAGSNMIAIDFFSADKDDPWQLKPKEDTWSAVLENIGKSMAQPMGTSRILMDGLVHVVSDTGIIIIKRNEKRFWTRGLAREDAEAAICKRMLPASSKEGTI